MTETKSGLKPFNYDDFLVRLRDYTPGHNRNNPDHALLELKNNINTISGYLDMKMIDKDQAVKALEELDEKFGGRFERETVDILESIGLGYLVNKDE